MGPLGPILTVVPQIAHHLAETNGGIVMPWVDAYPILMSKAKDAPSPILDQNGRPANSEGPKIIV